PDSAKSVRRTGNSHVTQETIHKDLVSFEVTGDRVRFAIRSTISWQGDVDLLREDYDLTLSRDGGQLSGTLRRIAHNEGNDGTNHSVPETLAPITLYPTDFAARSGH
ncbi:MAG TPA: hypothetical protein VGM36_14735, partial [Rhizomicrobium sp.]